MEGLYFYLILATTSCNLAFYILADSGIACCIWLMDRIKTMYFGWQIEVWKSTFWNCLHTWTEWKNCYHLDIKKIRRGEAFGVTHSLWCNVAFCSAEIFSTFAFFKETKEGRRRDGVSLSLWWNSIGASEPLSAGGIFALGNTVGKTVGFKDRGLAWAWSLRHPLVTLPLCHFSTFSNPSCGKRQSTTASGCHQYHSATYLQAQTW